MTVLTQRKLQRGPTRTATKKLSLDLCLLDFEGCFFPEQFNPDVTPDFRPIDTSEPESLMEYIFVYSYGQ